MRSVVCVTFLLALTGCRSAGVSGVADAVKTTLDVLRQTRNVLCTPALDPLMGDPREGQTVWEPKDAGVPRDGSVD